jgi:cell division protein FtsW
MSYRYYQPQKSRSPNSTRSSPSDKRGFVDILRSIERSSSVFSFIKQDGRRNSSGKPIVRRHRPDYYLVLFMALLWLFGLIVMFAISPQIVNVSNKVRGSDTNQYYYFIKHLISVLLAVVAFLIMRRVSMDFLKKRLIWLLSIGFGLCLLLFIISKISPETVCSLGACRWLRFGSFSIQVAEVLKLCLLIFFVFFWAYLSDNNIINQPRSLIWSVVLIGLATFITMVWQKDLGTSLALVIFLMLMIWMAGVKKRYVVGLMLVMLVFGILAIIAQPYRLERIKTFSQGDSATMSSSNRHSIEAKIALGSGGWFGLGVGNSIQSTGYLPEAINDSIFPIIGEIFGFIGTTIVLVLFAALLWRLLRGVIYSHSLLGRLMFVGVFGWVFAHLVLNVASMTGLAPVTGITLPFLSYGGTSMIFLAAALGLAFQASAYTAHTPYYREVRGKR